MPQPLQYFKVSRVYFSIGGNMRDPHVPDGEQYHHGIFVEMDESGAGRIHHAVGDVTSNAGMQYEKKERDAITRSATYHHHQVLGYVAASSYPQLEACLRSCHTPPQQKAYNATRNATEPFKTRTPLVFYNTDELENFQFPRLKKCKWWVEEQAIQLFTGPKCSFQTLQQHSEHSGHEQDDRGRSSLSILGYS